MSSPAGGEVRVGIGARLRAARERAGLTMLQAAEKLHVDSRVLEALESEDVERVGPPVFVRGHLRRYAELIGEQPAQLQGIYAATAHAPPDLTHVSRVRRPGDSRRLVAPGIIGLIAIAIAGAVWIVMQLGRSGAEQAVESTDLIVPQSEAPASESSGAMQSDTAPSASAPPSKSGSPAQVASRPPRQAATPPAAASPATGAGAESPPAPAPRPRTVAVKLKFAADSWVEVYDVNGERLFYDIGSADSERSVTGTPPLRVVLGNAAGVSLEVNGRARPVPANVVQNDGAQFTITRGGRISK